MKAIKLSAAVIGVAFAMPALGADLPRRGPVYKAPPPAAVSYNWSGCYVGGHVGYGWSRWRDDVLPNAVKLSDSGPGSEGDQIVFGYSGKIDSDGFLGGGQVGCDQQYGIWVFGLVADISWTDQKGRSGPFDIAPELPPDSVSEFARGKLEYFGTARARLGFASGNWLFYGTGGLAWARAKYTVEGQVAIAGNLQPPFSFSDTANHLGWAAGLGIEWMFMPNWTVGVEYLHLDLGSANYRFAGPFQNVTQREALVPGTSVDIRSDLVRATLNYRFGPRP